MRTTVMQMLSDWNELWNAIQRYASEGTPVYVRIDDNIARTIKRGHSVNQQNGVSESGISVNNLNAESETDAAVNAAEYAFIGGLPWLVTGEYVGRGSDNEPLLTNVRVLAEIDYKAIRQATYISKQQQAKRLQRRYSGDRLISEYKFWGFTPEGEPDPVQYPNE
jgi:hypothetical protein